LPRREAARFFSFPRSFPTVKTLNPRNTEFSLLDHVGAPSQTLLARPWPSFGNLFLFGSQRTPFFLNRNEGGTRSPRHRRRRRRQGRRSRRRRRRPRQFGITAAARQRPARHFGPGRFFSLGCLDFWREVELSWGYLYSENVGERGRERDTKTSCRRERRERSKARKRANRRAPPP